MLLTALSLAAALTTAAPDPATEGDLRCVAVIASVLGKGEVEGEVKAGLVGGMMFFVGRIEGREPTLDLKAALRRTFNSPTITQEIEDNRQRCADIMQSRGNLLMSLGNE